MSIVATIDRTPTFAILGGMGALASSALGHRFFQAAAAAGAQADADFPRLIQFSLAPTGLNTTGLAADQAARLAQDLVAQLDQLAQLGVDYVLPACNTISVLDLDHPELTIFDPVTITADDLTAAGYQRVGLLCSQTSEQMGLFTTPLTERGIAVISLRTDERTRLEQLIGQLMAGQRPVAELQNLINSLSARGAETVILGCSELSLLVSELDGVTDSMQGLLDRALATWSAYVSI